MSGQRSQVCGHLLVLAKIAPIAYFLHCALFISSHLLLLMHCVDNLMTPMLCSVHISAPTNRLLATLVRSELPVLSSLLISFSLTYMSHLSSPTSTPCSSSGSLHGRPAKPRDGYDAENTCIKPINSLEEPRLTSNIIQPRLQSVLCYSIDHKIKDSCHDRAYLI